MALAVHHPHAAPALGERLPDETGQRFARFIAAQSVQVDLALDRPRAAPQLVQHVGPDVGPPKAQAVVGQQQGLDVNLVGQRFAQRRRFIQRALAGFRSRAQLAGRGAERHLERRHRPHRMRKGMPLAFAAGGFCGFAGAHGRGFCLGGAHRIAHGAQVLEAVGLHDGPIFAGPAEALDSAAAALQQPALCEADHLPGTHDEVVQHPHVHQRQRALE
jgi:hypothetical protein